MTLRVAKTRRGNQSGFSLLDTMMAMGLAGFLLSVVMQITGLQQTGLAKVTARGNLMDLDRTILTGLMANLGDSIFSEVVGGNVQGQVGQVGGAEPSSEPLYTNVSLISTRACRSVSDDSPITESQKNPFQAAQVGGPVFRVGEPLASNRNLKVTEAYLVQITADGACTSCLTGWCAFVMKIVVDAERDEAAWVGTREIQRMVRCKTQGTRRVGDVTQANGEFISQCAADGSPEPSPTPSGSPSPLPGDLTGDAKVDGVDLELYSLFASGSTQLPESKWSQATLGSMLFPLDTMDSAGDRRVGDSGFELINANMGKTTQFKTCFSSTILARAYAQAAALAPPTSRVTLEDLEILEFCRQVANDALVMNDASSGCSYCSFASYSGGNVGALKCGEIDVDGYRYFKPTQPTPYTRTINGRDVRLAQIFMAINPSSNVYKQSGCPSMPSVTLPVNDWIEWAAALQFQGF